MHPTYRQGLYQRIYVFILFHAEDQDTSHRATNLCCFSLWFFFKPFLTCFHTARSVSSIDIVRNTVSGYCLITTWPITVLQTCKNTRTQSFFFFFFLRRFVSVFLFHWMFCFCFCFCFLFVFVCFCFVFVCCLFVCLIGCETSPVRKTVSPVNRLYFNFTYSYYLDDLKTFINILFCFVF